MTHDNDIINDLTTTRLSETVYKVKVFKLDGTPQPLDGLSLLLIAKKKIADADDAAVFTLTSGAGLEIDPDVTDGNGLIITIASEDTMDMSETKDSSLWCELLTTGNPRTTLGKRFPIPVLASLKRE
jgi:hypothetical protein